MSHTPRSSLQDDLKSFLGCSATAVEWMSEQLRSELSVHTGLEDVLAKAVEQERPIVIAGTAGSGKTHLLKSIGGVADYQLVPDLAAHDQKKWKSLLAPGKKVIVAGNEGAFLRGRDLGFAGYREVIEALHAIQRGTPHNTPGPVVIDAAGYDPSGSHAITQMLQMKVLKEYVSAERPDTEQSAWDMLSDASVAGRAAALVEVASAESEVEGFTFRQLWQFIGELVSGDPGGPWYERLFTGTSAVSLRLKQTFDIRTVPLPHVGNHLWHGDLTLLRPLFLPSAIPMLERALPAITRAKDVESRRKAFEGLRILTLFGLKDSPIDTLLHRGADLWSLIRGGSCPPLLQAINHYYSFGLINLGHDLELWLQHETERRQEKPNVQISLGKAATAGFEVRHSLVVANCPAGALQVKGGRRVLHHSGSGASIAITKDLIDGISKVRSHRVRDRRDVEYDWRLSQFFEAVASTEARSDELKVAMYSFQARSGRVVSWQLDQKIKRLTV